MSDTFKYREIPYNYTSFSDKEIILKYFDLETWEILNELRKHRVTGRSAKLLFEIMGDIFIIDRNPYIFNDYLENPHKLSRLKKLHDNRLLTIEQGANNDLVIQLIDKVRKINNLFFRIFSSARKERKNITRGLSEATSASNIFFSAFHKVLHVTDATDWRVEYPEVIVYPDSIDEIPQLIEAAKKTGLKVIPRGGGTGLTGGAIPVMRGTMIINTEKLRKIYDIERHTINGSDIPVIEVEAGVITETATEFCKNQGYIFATDPTSAWASSIGGNIAENAGGKKAVMWGTAIDNILSFKIINAESKLLEVVRRDHPHQKILPDDDVIFDIFRTGGKEKELVNTITLKGTDIRKRGIGKDITNKALGGLPGIQKEGGDGIIISAVFVLYTPFNHTRTLCLEFFGKDMVNASKAIVDITGSFTKNPDVFLTALEHFDEKYVSAINYRNKSDRTELPKAVLLIDIESNDENKLEEACSQILKRVVLYNTEGFIAVNEKDRETFWKDRKNLGAIAKHTNAFKLNEDVVIPLESLPGFSDYIDMLNIQKELENHCSTLGAIQKFILEEQNKSDQYLSSKITLFNSKIKSILDRCTYCKDNLDVVPDNTMITECAEGSRDKTILECIRDGDISLNFNNDIVDSFHHAFHGYDEIIDTFNNIVADTLSKKIIVATHMHAGDGNIHVNIPVHSNDYLMLQEADETAGIIMEKVKSLGGVISGEHGIGLTKLKFIEQSILDEYAEYKQAADPDDLFNPGKLRSDFPVNMIYTPSLNLLEKEAFILEATDLETLTNSISACVRCGKCKEVCNTHSPAVTMFYSPRNKILGVSLIIEAVLYEAQIQNTLGFRNFKMLREISNHCTMCHNCKAPCPVNIDFGDVTLSIRDLLVQRHKAPAKYITTLTLFYLKRRGYLINKLFRIALLKIGYTFQRAGYYINAPFAKLTELISPVINSFFTSRLPAAGRKTIREEFKLTTKDSFFSFQNPHIPVNKSVVYFPGCGSERMFSEISFAVIALLYMSGVRVVIPPEYLCCGYPLLANGKVKSADLKSYENRVIFHRIADISGYMEIHDIIVSCGTCYEMLSKYHIENIFHNSAIIDITEFIAREQLFSLSEKQAPLLYHEPCHTPLRHFGYEQTFSMLSLPSPQVISNCCGEGGTLALSTPVIANALRERKKGNIVVSNPGIKEAQILTTCPSCVQGLSRINKHPKITGKSLAVYIAESILGANWKKDFIKDVKKNNAIEKILF